MVAVIQRHTGHRGKREEGGRKKEEGGRKKEEGRRRTERRRTE